MEPIFKSLLKSTAKIADLPRALELKGFRRAPAPERSATFTSEVCMSFVSFTNRIVDISAVVCPSASPLIPEAVPVLVFVCNLSTF